MIKSVGFKIIVILLFILYVIQFGHYDFSGWRYIRARVLVDNEYINTKKDWATDIPAIIEKTSEFYEKRFKIKLIITGWGKLITTQELADFEELALSDNNDGNEILIGFTGRDMPFNQAARMFSMILISGEGQTQESQTEDLKHEVAHLFLARHRPATDNIINDDFDGFNKFIIRLNKYKNFQIGKIFYRIYLSLLKTDSIKILI